MYILECCDGRFYIGMTNNVEKRLSEHKSGEGGRFTRSFGVKKLIYQEEYATKQEAMKREAQVKGFTKKQKIALVQDNLKISKYIS